MSRCPLHCCATRATPASSTPTPAHYHSAPPLPHCASPAAALGEGGGGSTYGGCFPLFANSTQFEQYLNGEFQFDTSSAAVGITLRWAPRPATC